MELTALILAVVTLVLFLVAELVRRPSLDIAADRFVPSAPTPWTFAAVRVYNRPPPRPFTWIFSRNVAQACAITVDFEEWDRDVRVAPDVGARWSANPQPIRRVPPGSSDFAATTAASAGPTGASLADLARPQYEYDPTLDPRTHDIPVSPDGEHCAVAILYPDGSEGSGAYAFGTESYAYPAWRKPEWKLERGTYRVRVTVTGSSVRCQRSFKLEYLDNDFAKFVLHRI